MRFSISIWRAFEVKGRKRGRIEALHQPVLNGQSKPPAESVRIVERITPSRSHLKRSHQKVCCVNLVIKKNASLREEE